MAEQMKKYYQKEEEFLDEFPGIGSFVAKFLNNAWQPDFDCDDSVRHNRAYFQLKGELHELAFNGAAIFHDQEGFSSVHIHLRSSQRVVTIVVRKDKTDYVAEKITDRLVNNEA